MSINSKKILLVYPGPDQIKSYRFGYSLLLLYIAADLKKQGYEVAILDYSVLPYSRESFEHESEGAVAVVIEIDAFPLKRSTNIGNARSIATDARLKNDLLPIIAVGKQCTLFHTSLDFVDTTISGDSELFVSTIIEKIFRHEEISRYYEAGSVSDLSLLPRPAYELLPEEQIRGKTATRHMSLAPSALMETSRGCPGKCSFCQRKGWEERVLVFPVSTVLQNYTFLLKSGIRNIWITDENFAGKIRHAKTVLRTFAGVPKNEQVKISISSWVHIDREFLDLSKSAGVSIISFGIESITPENQVFYQKRLDCEKVLEMLEYADSIGLYTIGNFIIGSPFDTEKTIQANMRFALDSKLDVVNIKTLDYMMGAELYDRLPLEQQGELHFFSCKERGVSPLSANEIKNFCTLFSTTFQKDREIPLAQKIQKFGTPYFEEIR